MPVSSGFSTSRPALKSLALAVALALSAGAAAAQEKVLRIAMTAGDIPRTSGQPEAYINGLQAEITPEGGINDGGREVVSKWINAAVTYIEANK